LLLTREGATPRPLHRLGRLLVVSHPSVIPVNQTVYARLVEVGWDVLVALPNRWFNEYSRDAVQPQAAPGLEGRLRPLPVVLAGRPQRHFYAVAPRRLLRSFRPDVAFVEEECFSVSATQWGLALHRFGIPFGLQAAENLDRPIPAPARVSRSWVLRHAAFIAARSPAGGDLVRRWGAVGDVRLVPHAIPPWHAAPHRAHETFTVGYAGRLVAAKGLWDLLGACALLREPVRLHLVGDGPLRPALEQARRPNVDIHIDVGRSHDRMPEAYAEMDVLVLPSRTTSRWTEQFGRVLVEALSCGVPVVASDSGEIPWVVATTGGGRIFPEGDVLALARLLTELRDRPEERTRLAREGREQAVRLFGVDAIARELDDTLRAAVDRVTGRAGVRPTVALVAHGVHDRGGMERACAELVRRGSDRYRFVVYSSELDPGLAKLATWKRIVVPRRPIPLKFVAFFVTAGLRLFRSPADLVHSVGAVVPNRVDVVSVHFCHAGFRGRTGRLAPAGRTFFRRINTTLARLAALGAERWSYRPDRARHLAAVSTGVASELQSHYPQVPTSVAPNGTDAERFQPDPIVRRDVRLSERVKPTDVVALFLGGDWDHKGLKLAIDGLARASSELDEQLLLWVVGLGNERRFRAIAESGDVGDRVRFFGVVTDPQPLYQAADIFVLPTLYETFSLAAFEAAASGLPLVAPAVSGIEELIGKDEAGIIVERTPESVASALVRLAADEELRMRLGEVGRRRAAKYTWDRSVESIVRLYGQLLADRVALTA
jgi:UDP-glucose:(heptosyl)LPS alpha-1,3-glucosyltransferase